MKRLLTGIENSVPFKASANVFSVNNTKIKLYLNKLKQFIEFKLSKILSKRKNKFVSLPFFKQINLSLDVRVRTADIINLYWINAYF